VFPRFYDVINAFGFKSTEDDKVWEGFHSHRSFIPGEDLKGDRLGRIPTPWLDRGKSKEYV